MSALYDDFAPPEIAARMRERAKAYRMIENCENCPFLDNGKVIKLAKGRVAGIKRDILRGQDFYCHKAVYAKPRDEEDDESFIPRKGDLLCHGACEYQDEHGMMSQFRRIAERLDATAADREQKAVPS